MTRTVDLSVSGRTRQYLVATVLVGSFVVPIFGAILSVAGLTVAQAFAGAAGGWVVAAVLWVRQFGGDDDGDTWAAIPDWQYDGRFAEAGGLTRSEQEEAIEDLQEGN